MHVLVYIMKNLTDVNHNLLSKNVLKCLAQNNIKNILDFIQEDAEKLIALTKLNFSEILEIRNEIFRKYSASTYTGSSLFSKSQVRERYLNTGMESLNVALGGGLPLGFITEVYGLAGCGKTQLCFQLAIHNSRNTENNILYIDTKGDFSPLRIQKILDNLGCSHQEMARVLHKIKIVQIWTMEELIELMKNMKRQVINTEKLTLIIIDSLPCLMFQHFGDDNKVGLTYLNIFVNYCRYLAKQYNISVVCVNIQTRWVEKDFIDCFDEDDQEKENLSVEKHNRCLGKYWRHIPSYVILLERIMLESSNSKNNSLSIKATVTTSSGMKLAQECILNVNSLGVS